MRLRALSHGFDRLRCEWRPLLKALAASWTRRCQEHNRFPARSQGLPAEHSGCGQPLDWRHNANDDYARSPWEWVSCAATQQWVEPPPDYGCVANLLWRAPEAGLVLAAGTQLQSQF